MLASLTVTASGILLFVAAAFAYNLWVGLSAVGLVLTGCGLIIPERGRR